MISIIVALAPDNAIGYQQQLLWKISEDLHYFKRVTTGHTVMMGLNTFASIGHPLPNRRNIVLSNIILDPVPDGIELAASLPDAVSLASHPHPAG
ncbi:MAG: dihydrofolate reductase, partial [Bacteroidetes bacterium]|nr:dihydrofolate reductase [Bacteroidota bacterium]